MNRIPVDTPSLISDKYKKGDLMKKFLYSKTLFLSIVFFFLFLGCSEVRPICWTGV